MKRLGLVTILIALLAVGVAVTLGTAAPSRE